MASGLSGLDWKTVVNTGILFIVLALTQRALHAHALIIPVVLVGVNRFALWLYFLLMFPGVLVHELSHAIAATLLLVDVHSLSVRPRVEQDGIVLGEVYTGGGGFLRHSIVGLAPLIAGLGTIFGISAWAFNFAGVHRALVASDWSQAATMLTMGFSNGWDWLAVYLIFAVSVNMFPSRSDRRYWLPVLLFLALALGVAVATGFISPLVDWLIELINILFRQLLFIIGFTLIVDLPILLLFVTITRAVVRPLYSD